MFVRVKNKPNNKKSDQIVKNVRVGRKVKQKNVHHVGMAIDEHSDKYSSEERPVHSTSITQYRYFCLL